MSREYFCAYHSLVEAVTPLGDAERGRFFMACLQYSMTGEMPELRGNERFIFPSVKAQIDRDNERYKERCETNRANGAKGGQANATERKRTLPNAPQDKDKEKDKDKRIPPYISPPGDFDRFWEAYPKKAGKKDAIKAWAKLKPDLDSADTILVGLEQCKRSQQWREGFIPNPATFLNGERWKDMLPTRRGKPQGYQQHEVTDSDLSGLLVDLDADFEHERSNP